MRAKRNMRNPWYLLLLALAFIISSCSSDDNSTSVSYNDYCYIKSVTLGTMKCKVEKRDRLGNLINTFYSSFTGSNYLMTINQRTGLIENRTPLPYGTQLSAVVATITFDGSVLKYRVKDSNTEWTAYNSTDSLDLTKPLELHLTSNDAQSSRIYYFKVNVYAEEGDSLYWKQCESEVEPLTGMTDTKAFVMDDNLMVLGKKSSGIVLAERSGIEADGIWEENATTGLPVEADLQTLRQQDGKLYVSTDSVSANKGKIFSSTDAKNWSQVGTTHTAALTLIDKTADYFYAISEGKLLRSTDAENWEEESGIEISKLPLSDIRALSVRQTNGNNRIILVGQREEKDDAGNEVYPNALVWSKMWNKIEPEKDAEWIYFPLTSDNTVPCPRIEYFNMLSYDGKCIAFGGASKDGTHKALDAMYISQDYGITWRPSTELHMPVQLEGIEGCITSTVDKNNFIWIITNAQVWRGRLNRLGFAQQ